MGNRGTWRGKLKQGQKNTKARAKDKIIIEEYIHEINTKIFKVRTLFIPVNSDSEWLAPRHN